jgi:hypothetical protein
MNVRDEQIRQLLSDYKKFCVYGLSPDPAKPSHYVPLYMREHGWEMIGVYPKVHSANGFSIVESLQSVAPEYRKFVDVFRASDKIPQLVDEVLSVGGVEVLWLQLAISHPEAEARAERAGMRVVSNRCLIVEHRKWFEKS